MTDYGASSYHRFLDGEAGALEELVRAYSDCLTQFAYLYVRDFAAAEDIMEDTFATLIVKRRPFINRFTFKAYLYRITQNKCIDYLRKHKRLVPLEDFSEVLTTEDTERNILKRERERKIYECLQQLDFQYRDVLFFRFFEQYSVEEIAEIMCKSHKQVYNLLAKAKAHLKKILLKEGIHYDDI